MIASNMKLVRGTWNKATASLDIRARMARDEMMAALIQLSKEQIQGARPYTVGPRGGKVYEKAISGHPPMNRTGDLRRSIRGERFNIGFANYSAIVGPTIVYGRQVELGGGNWPSGTHFPYMQPAWVQFQSAVAPQIVSKFFKL